MSEYRSIAHPHPPFPSHLPSLNALSILLSFCLNDHTQVPPIYIQQALEDLLVIYFSFFFTEMW